MNTVGIATLTVAKTEVLIEMQGQISITARRHPHHGHQSKPANTRHSYGWATLIVAGGGAYFFAKRSINADRAQKAEMDRQKRARIYALEQGLETSQPPTTPLNPTARPGSTRSEANPSMQANQDPAPTRHAPMDEGQRVGEKSKYEASDVYRSRKGDRFS
ncbi:putative SET-like protein [Stemphylium lycopersici]|uniref:SET-like protein n=1 Tax=Stemphylium lycopersici TaxID=183478 RepID=A0A364MWR7_STELY|nr:hypothetical protein TW65_01039 [Stemphylium lycopersici]RAR00102.1 putative SET-like protein [Stemphylium lycopersici]RAR05769.1 SET-like protein [Stemphylium lycopersici]